jgi:FKBP-type peptidyl-prolyl cis-trans isomerase FklB
MHKSFTIVMNIFAAGMLLGNALAQQTPAATTPAATTPAASQAPATTTPAASAKAQTPGAKKPAAAARTAAPLTLKTQKEKFSYAVGMKMGENFKKQSVPVDVSIYARGMKDALAGGKALMTDEEAQSAIQAVQKEMQAKMQEKAKEAADANKKEGEAFLAGNKGKEGVVVLPSGLQYKILKAGTGSKPTPTDSVVCNYSGKLLDGKEFDSSYKRGQPATFPVTGVIKGWTEALQLMPVGSKWQLFIPSDLAYGDRGAGADIGPGATLVFDVELMSIEDKSKDQTPAKDEKK